MAEAAAAVLGSRPARPAESVIHPRNSVGTFRRAQSFPLCTAARHTCAATDRKVTSGISRKVRTSRRLWNDRSLRSRGPATRPPRVLGARCFWLSFRKRFAAQPRYNAGRFSRKHPPTGKRLRRSAERFRIRTRLSPKGKIGGRYNLFI